MIAWLCALRTEETGGVRVRVRVQESEVVRSNILTRHERQR